MHLQNYSPKLKIFISAYACEPGLGSEIGVGWHWVLEMSKYFELWVLTRESNRHTIEPWLAEHPEYGHIHFLYYDWPQWARFWKKGLRGVRTYYNIWQFCTNDIVRRTMQENDIHIFHHLTYGNVLWKVSSYGQKQFFIWGPVGGLESIPTEFSNLYDRKLRLVEWMRRTMIKFLPVNAGFRGRCKHANLILCKTNITLQLIPAAYRHKGISFTDVAVEKCEQKPMKEIGNTEANFLMVGRLDAWRGFDLAIEGLDRAVKEEKQIHLTIVGKGADKERLERMISRYGLEEHVTMAGEVSMMEYKQLLAETDCMVNASLKEGAVTVSFDCLAMGKPLICLDTTGYTRYFTNNYAIVIPIENREQVVEALKAAMLRMTNKEERRKLGEQAGRVGERFTWESRGKEISEVIRKVYQGEN